MRRYVLVLCAGIATSACGGGDGKKVKKPKGKKANTEETAKPETEDDRDAKRRKQAQKIVPDGSACLPVALKEDGAPRLELAAFGQEAIVCAMDIDQERLLGPVGCWTIDLATGGLTYKDAEPLPGRGFSVRLDDRCARGFCVPKEAKLEGKVAHMAWDIDGKKVAVLVGEDVHLFDAKSKDHESSFSVTGDKGVTNKPTAVHFVGSTIVVEGTDDGPYSAVWVFKTDGTKVGPVLALGGKEEKPLSTYKGSLSILDKARIAISEKGMETLTVYEIETGKRSKLVRNAKKPACKPAELDAFWHDGDKVGDKCKGSIEALTGHLMGATAVAGAKNFLVLLRGDRLGELGVLDSKSLAEKKSIKMAWCAEGGGGDGAAAEDGGSTGGDKEEAKDDEPPKAKDNEKAKDKKGTRGAKSKDSSDPEEGGE